MKRKRLLIVIISMFFLICCAISLILVKSYGRIDFICSINPNYKNDEPGSFEVEPLNYWADIGELVISNSVNTEEISAYDSYDVILMMDQYQGTLEKMKSDAIEFITEKLKLGNYRFAIMTYEYYDPIIAINFTDNLEELTTTIQNIQPYFEDGIYCGDDFDKILYNYEHDNNVAIQGIIMGNFSDYIYSYSDPLLKLKKEHPYFFVDLINYDSTNKIYTCNKYECDTYHEASSTKNTLLNVKPAPSLFENFVIEQQINTDIFEAPEEDNDYEIIKTDDNKVIARKKVTNMISGKDYSIGGYNLKLKEEYQNEYETYDSIIHTKVNYKIGDYEDTLISDHKTSISTYTEMRYDINLPGNCELVGEYEEFGRELSLHSVEYPTNKLECGDYIFKGWALPSYNSSGPIYSNDDYYVVPTSSYQLRAKWEKISVNLDSTGNVTEEALPYLQPKNAENKSYFWNNTSGIKKITFESEFSKVENASYTYDLSRDQNQTVMAYLVYVDGYLEAHIQADGKIIAPSDMSHFFEYWSSLQSIEGLENLDTSNVENMSYLFSNCNNLIESVDFSKNDTSKVKDVSYMFNSAKIDFVNNFDFSKFDMSSVENMSYMFNYVNSGSELNIENINAPNAINVSHFIEGYGLPQTININNLNIPKAKNLEYFFGRYSSYYTKNVYISGLTALNAENISYMFYPFQGIENFGITNSTIKNVKNASYLFNGFGSSSLYYSRDRFKIDLDLNFIDMSNVENISYIFSNLVIKSLDIDTWKTPKLKEAKHAFYGFSAESLKFSNMDFSNVQDFSGMFYNLGSRLVYNDNYKEPSDSYMPNYKLPEIKWPTFNTKSATNFNKLFYGVHADISNINYSDWDTSNVTDMSYMFAKTGYGPYVTNLENLNLRKWNTSKVTDMSYMFSNQDSLKNIDVGNFDTSNVTNMEYMFNRCALTYLDLSSFYTGKVTNMKWMFAETKLEYLDISNFNTSNVTNMESMFHETYLTSLDLSHFNTSKVTDMSSMFSHNGKLETLNVSNFDTGNVTDMSWMFTSCGSLLQLDLNSFNTSNVTNFDFMFAYCENLSDLNVSSFNTEKATTINSMFNRCHKLTSLDLSHFVINNIQNLSYLFNECTSLTEIKIPNFNTNKTTDMSYMFNKCSSLTSLDLSNFDTNMVENFDYMFNECTSLEELKIPFFNFESATTAINMFNKTNKIKTVLNAAKYPALGNAQLNNFFLESAIMDNSNVIINYNARNKASAENLLNFKSDNSRVYLGEEQPESAIIIDGDDEVIATSSASSDMTSAYPNEYITLKLENDDGYIKSFKLNGKYIEGDTFSMPNGNAKLSEIDVVRFIIFESAHNPYKSTNMKYEKDFGEDCKKIRLILKHEIYRYSDFVITSPKNKTIYGSYDAEFETEEIILEGNKLAFEFKHDYSNRTYYYYGFKVYIEPIYE